MVFLTVSVTWYETMADEVREGGMEHSQPIGFDRQRPDYRAPFKAKTNADACAQLFKPESDFGQT